MHWRIGPSARARSIDSPRITSGCGPLPICRPPHSRRSATSWPSTSRCSTRARTSSRSTSRAGCPAPSAPPSRRASSWARAAARVHVVDSATACGGEGLIVLAAAAAARDGADAAAVADRARRARAQLKMWFAVETLEYLRRGGRIAGASGLAGLGAEDQADPHGRVRDRPDRAGPDLTARVRAAGRPVPRAACRRRRRLDGAAHPSARSGRQSWPRGAARSSAASPGVVSEIGPVIGTHVGPGLLGAGAIPSALL